MGCRKKSEDKQFNKVINGTIPRLSRSTPHYNFFYTTSHSSYKDKGYKEYFLTDVCHIRHRTEPMAGVRHSANGLANYSGKPIYNLLCFSNIDL